MSSTSLPQCAAPHTVRKLVVNVDCQRSRALPPVFIAVQA